MITLFKKDNCMYCTVMEDKLKSLKVDYVISDSKSPNGAYPTLVAANGETFVGLGSFLDFVAFVKDNEQY